MKLLPHYDTLEEAARDGYYSITGIAREIGQSRQAVHAWHCRRRTTNFPDVTAQYRRDVSRVAPLFNLEAVKKWRRSYVPAIGGRPKSVAR